MLKNYRRGIAHLCRGEGLVFVECQVIGAEGVAEHVSRPRSEIRDVLQPLVPLAVTTWDDRSGGSRHSLQSRGEIIGNGNDAPLPGFCLSSRNFYELLLARLMNVLPIERRELASAESGKEAEGSGG